MFTACSFKTHRPRESRPSPGPGDWRICRGAHSAGPAQSALSKRIISSFVPQMFPSI